MQITEAHSTSLGAPGAAAGLPGPRVGISPGACRAPIAACRTRTRLPMDQIAGRAEVQRRSRGDPAEITRRGTQGAQGAQGAQRSPSMRSAAALSPASSPGVSSVTRTACPLASACPEERGAGARD